MTKLDSGSAHGRFQPLHKGHLEYLIAAKQRCRFLWIGITQPDIRSLQRSPADRHRELPLNNPLTYYERIDMITQALVDEGIRRAEFDTIPFPIDTPSLLTDFLPTTVPVFTTIYDSWNRHKAAILRDSGYRVIVLYERNHKVYEGTRVRQLLLAGDPDWGTLVPEATVRAATKFKLRERLLALASDTGTTGR
jgi:nicotinamide mononucleotide adenylyltransferase